MKLYCTFLIKQSLDNWIWECDIAGAIKTYL